MTSKLYFKIYFVRRPGVANFADIKIEILFIKTTFKTKEMSKVKDTIFSISRKTKFADFR